MKYCGHALRAQALWRAKAAELGLQLSSTKGHKVDQGVPFVLPLFCWIHVDPLHGRYTMLPEKVTSCHSTFASVLDASPRILAQARGKAGHYCCAVQFLALGCALLSQAMHQSEV